MKVNLEKPHIWVYGEMFSALKASSWTESMSRAPSFYKAWKAGAKDSKHYGGYVFVSSKELDDTFVGAFRKHATEATRLLVLSEGMSSDRLLSRMIDLKIRTPQRFCVIDADPILKRMQYSDFVGSLLARLTSAYEIDGERDRILDAKIEGNILHVVSQNLARLEVPIGKIPELKDVSLLTEDIEIDEDGSFIYFPKADLHLGWMQLQQIVNPELALKASQKSREFNVRYGRAIQQVREQAGLTRADVNISEKQLKRIESGQCRLTAKAATVLAAAHGFAPNEYLKRLAEHLK